MTDKNLLRKEYRKKLTALSGVQRAALSAAIRSVLSTWQPFKSARSLIAFHPMSSEPDIVPLLVKAISAGHHVGLVRTPDGDPYIEVLEVRLWDGSESSLERHRRMSLRQPDSRLPLLDNAAWNQARSNAAVKNIELLSADAGLVLVPALAFGRDGSRLGHGSGWYDRFLLAKPSLLRVGIGFGMQITESLPMDIWDQNLDFLICEEGIQACPTRT